MPTFLTLPHTALQLLTSRFLITRPTPLPHPSPRAPGSVAALPQVRALRHQAQQAERRAEGQRGTARGGHGQGEERQAWGYASGLCRGGGRGGRGTLNAVPALQECLQVRGKGAFGGGGMTERGGGEGQRGSTAQRTAGWAGARGPQRKILQAHKTWRWVGPAAGINDTNHCGCEATPSDRLAAVAATEAAEALHCCIKTPHPLFPLPRQHALPSAYPACRCSCPSAPAWAAFSVVPLSSLVHAAPSQARPRPSLDS